jgi:hypothetical protein
MRQTQPNQAVSWIPLLFASVLGLGIVGVAAAALGVVSTAPEAQIETTAAPISTRRCPECGWIESKRSVPSGADNLSIRSDEYTVRMGDGSTRIFTGGPAERWRLGERLKFIDGEL